MAAKPSASKAKMIACGFRLRDGPQVGGLEQERRSTVVELHRIAPFALLILHGFTELSVELGSRLKSDDLYLLPTERTTRRLAFGMLAFGMLAFGSCHLFLSSAWHLSRAAACVNGGPLAMLTTQRGHPWKGHPLCALTDWGHPWKGVENVTSYDPLDAARYLRAHNVHTTQSSAQGAREELVHCGCIWIEEA